MTRSTKPLIALLLLALPLGGCATSSIGLGSSAAVPPPAPAISNSPILESLNANDRARAEQARQAALDGKAGKTVDWKSDQDAQTYGAVVAGPLTQQNGQQCRQYSLTVYNAGVPSNARATACHQANGSWTNS